VRRGKLHGLTWARCALGIDLSQTAVGHACSHYANEKTKFRCTDATALEDAEDFDAIVSIETIEHLPDPESFVAQMADRVSADTQRPRAGPPGTGGDHRQLVRNGRPHVLSAPARRDPRAAAGALDASCEDPDF
jgi:SAM-dependent methyltransferase